MTACVCSKRITTNQSWGIYTENDDNTIVIHELFNNSPNVFHGY